MSTREPRHIVVANKKGGVGKTTTAVQTAHALVRLKGKDIKCLLVDNDPQANATQTLLGLEKPHQEGKVPVSLVDLYRSQPGADPRSFILPTTVPNLDLIAGHSELTDIEMELVSRTNRETVLKRKLKDLAGYDYVIFDCGPNWGLITRNPVYAAREIIVPVTFSAYAVSGVDKFVEEVLQFVDEMAATLRIAAILPLRIDQRFSSRMAEFAERIRAKYPRAAAPQIRTDETIEKAQTKFKTVFQLDPKCKAAEDYEALALFLEDLADESGVG